jgi:hypothetical protein
MTEDQEAALAALTKELKAVLPGKVERDVREKHPSIPGLPQLLETVKLSIVDCIVNTYQQWTAETSIHIPVSSKVGKPRRSATSPTTTKRKAPDDSSQRDQRSVQNLQVPETPRSNRYRQLLPSFSDSPRGRYSSRDAVRRTVPGSFSTQSISHGSRSDTSAEESIRTPDQVLPQISFDSRPPIGQDVTGMQPAGIVTDPFKDSNASDIYWNTCSAPNMMNTNASGVNPSMYQVPKLYGGSSWSGMQGPSNSIAGHLPNEMSSPTPDQFARRFQTSPQMLQMQFTPNANMDNQQQAQTLAVLNMEPPWNGGFNNGSLGNNNFNSGNFGDGSLGNNNFNSGNFGDGSFGNGSFEDDNIGNGM